ncbi:hypothetical protein [Acidaminococcus sp. DS4831]|uniref:hypothetical protein n=1 Tax=Acidaminococcus sp. DS4831 TaxID=3141399 RepID=UPI0032E4AD9E
MFYVIKLGWQEEEDTGRVDRVLARALRDHPHQVVGTAAEFARLFPEEGPRGSQRLLFVVNLARGGMSLGFAKLIAYVSQHRHCLENCVGSVVVDGAEELFTKKAGREMIFLANRSGCSFPGAPLVEATGSLYNFNIQAKLQGVDNLEAYENAVERLVGTAPGLPGGPGTGRRKAPDRPVPCQQPEDLQHLAPLEPGPPCHGQPGPGTGSEPAERHRDGLPGLQL